MLQVRETAHEALREARELARGYRPLDLDTEVDGAVSLLRSAGVSASADLADLPEAWHEPMARVIREAVTNVLRHSSATRVEMRYADGAVVIRNDGLPSSPRPRLDEGTGLAGLAEHLDPLGARADTQSPTARTSWCVPSWTPQPGPAGEDSRMIRVLLADDENLIRSALAQMLDLEDDLEVVAEAANGAEALAAARTTRSRRGRARPADARPGRDQRGRSSWAGSCPSATA